MLRPERLVVIAGTGTEVGKTWVARRLLQLARARSLRVAARKPVQSFSAGDGLTDAQLLAAASGESPETVCPAHRSYAVPMAPPMAADVLGLPGLRLDELLSEITWPEQTQLGLLETAGGLRSPIAHDGDNVDLIERIDPEEVLLVADAGLGTVNAVRLSVQALGARRSSVLLNRFDGGADLHRRNRDWLQQCGLRVVTSVEEWLRVVPQ